MVFLLLLIFVGFTCSMLIIWKDLFLIYFPPVLNISITSISYLLYRYYKGHGNRFVSTTGLYIFTLNTHMPLKSLSSDVLITIIYSYSYSSQFINISLSSSSTSLMLNLLNLQTTSPSLSHSQSSI